MGKVWLIASTMVRLAIVGLPIAFSASTLTAETTTPAALQRLVDELAAPSDSLRASLPVIAPKFLAKFYEQRNYQPAWSDPRNADILRQAIVNAPSHGLKLEDFHPHLFGLPGKNRIPVRPDAERDILMTDALLRLLYQFYFGKVSPNKIDTDWNLAAPTQNQDALRIISDALDQTNLEGVIEKASPPGVTYQRLRGTLHTYRNHQKNGGWPAIPEGPLIKPGLEDPRVPVIRARLNITGDYTWRDRADDPLYDEVLVSAIKRFQRNHGLDVDSVIGPATLAAMNVPVEKRIDQIRVNLERARWIVRPLIKEKDLVAVNIAGFYLLVRLDGKFVWWSNVITGKPYHKTPIFTDTIRYIEFNPTWTIPPGILRNEILPAIKADPTYLDRKGYDLIDWKRRKVSPSSVNWTPINARNFPYRVVQPPGPDNALGLVKFMFPNKHNVYLHDTPSRALFSKTGRAFSHGCVRVKDPMKLAEILLGNRNAVGRDKIDEIVASTKQTRINLKKPIKVAILYWTVDPIWQGGIRFYKDIYGRDDKILKALNAPFKLLNK